MRTRILKRTLLALSLTAFGAFAADKEILLFAGKPSHPPGQHEHNAGVLLLQKSLSGVKGLHVTVALNGDWPEAAAIENADAIFFFADGGEVHPVFVSEDRVAAINKAAARGAGLMFMHFATEPPAQKGHDEMLAWTSGYFELNYTVNPIWDAEIKSLPFHPITRGVKPFTIRDEWYFNVRLPERIRNFTPILIATPPKETISDKDGIRLGNADVRSKAGQPMFLAWAVERQDGGRGVSWTGGHYHKNLGNEDVRRLILNSLLWIAKMDVPANGVPFTVTEAEMTDNLDTKAMRPRPTAPVVPLAKR